MDLLFDLDGTLTDPFPGIAGSISHALSMLGRPAPTPERLRRCIGPPLRDSFAALLASDDEKLVERAVGLYRQRYGESGLYENRVYEGIPEVLAGLRANGHRLYVATAKPAVYARRIVDHFGLGPWFDHVYGSELDGTRGRKADLIGHILREEGLAPAGTAMIGDRQHDVIGAAANGLDGFGVLWGYGTAAELATAGARGIFRSPGELVAAFPAPGGSTAI